FEGRAVLQAYLPNREARHPTAWPARSQRAPCEAYRLRRAATRKTKGQAHLRYVGAPVPALFPKSYANERRDRRKPALIARAPLGQRRLPAGIRDIASAGPPVRHSRTCSRERSQGRYTKLSSEGRRRGFGSRRQPLEHSHPERVSDSIGSRATNLARGGFPGRDAG